MGEQANTHFFVFVFLFFWVLNMQERWV